MADKQKIITGILVFLLVSSGIVYVTFSDQVRIRVDHDQTSFYVPHENYSWIWTVSGREVNSLFDGTSKMNRNLSSISVNTYFDEDNKSRIVRNTTYIRGPKIVDTYYFDGNVKDVELFPIRHKIEVYNASDYFYRYEARDLEYSGDTYKLDGQTELSFGKNMKIELQEDYRWAWVYKSGIVKAQYDIDSDYEVFDIRLFDPPKPYEIEGNKVFINDSDAYISALPHTLTKSSNAEFEIKSKKYTGDINVLWGFNESITRPEGAELYNPTNETWNTSHSKLLENVTNYVPTELTCDYGNEYNEFKYEVTYGLTNGTNNTQTTEVFCFDSYTQNGSDYTLNWETKHWEIKEWHGISGDLGKIKYNLNGKDTLYYATNVPIEANQTYKVRTYLNVKPNSSGKYDFAVYPSSYGITEQGILDAYNDGNLYLLDPWWNSTYDERYLINPNGSGYTGIGSLGVNITGLYATIGNDTATGDVYFYNDTSTGNWAIANDTTELCGYNTDTDVSSCPLLTGSAEGLISKYDLDRSSGDVMDYVGGNDGTNNGATRGVTGQVGDAFDFDGTDDYIDVGAENLGYDYVSISLWINADTWDTSGFNHIINGDADSSGNQGFMFRQNSGNIEFLIRQGTSWEVYSFSNPTTGEWHHLAFTWDGSTVRIELDDTEKVSQSLSGTLDNFYISSIGNRLYGSGGSLENDRHFDGKIDDVRIYNRALTSTEVSNLYSSTSSNFPYLEGAETEGPVAKCTFNGTTKDTSGNAISDARVVISEAETDTVKANISVEVDGTWQYNITDQGNYTVWAYEPGNKTRGGDIKPYIECIPE